MANYKLYIYTCIYIYSGAHTYTMTCFKINKTQYDWLFAWRLNWYVAQRTRKHARVGRWSIFTRRYFSYKIIPKQRRNKYVLDWSWSQALVTPSLSQDYIPSILTRGQIFKELVQFIVHDPGRLSRGRGGGRGEDTRCPARWPRAAELYSSFFNWANERNTNEVCRYRDRDSIPWRFRVTRE